MSRKNGDSSTNDFERYRDVTEQRSAEDNHHSIYRRRRKESYTRMFVIISLTLILLAVFLLGAVLTAIIYNVLP